jgi:hypothetical protein
VSCASIGSCGAVGQYNDSAGHSQAFVLSEAGGRWRKAIEVPASASLNIGGNAATVSISCTSAGDCSAGGYYLDGAGHFQAFVVTQRNGTWGKAGGVPALAALNSGGSANIDSISCGSAGNCSAGGYYLDGAGHFQAFVASQGGGRWRNAVEVAGTAGLNAGGDAAINTVSCATTANCSAGGFYKDGAGRAQAFVVTQRLGKWGQAVEVSGMNGFNAGGFATINAISCASAGNCAAGGFYDEGPGRSQAFVVGQRNGHWGLALKVPGMATLNAGGGADIGSGSVSCASPGVCTAGGIYTDGRGHTQSFVVSERKWRWGKALEVPGTATLNHGNAAIESLSCAPAGRCSAGGSYKDRFLNGQAFVVSQT